MGHVFVDDARTAQIHLGDRGILAEFLEGFGIESLDRVVGVGFAGRDGVRRSVSR